MPLVLAVLGIVLRGSGFAFRKSVEGLSERRAAGATFALSSVITPFFMGTVVGAIAVGNVPAHGGGDAFSSWIAPAPLFIGAMFVATSAYLAAVFLVGDTRRVGDKEMERYFERRALAAGVVAGIFAVIGLIALHSEGHYVYDRLVHQGLPLVIVSAVCGGGMLAALLLGGRLLLRPLAAGAVIAVIWGWFVAQFPYLLPTSLKISEAAAPDATLGAIFIVFGDRLRSRPPVPPGPLHPGPDGHARTRPLILAVEDRRISASSVARLGSRTGVRSPRLASLRPCSAWSSTPRMTWPG